MDNKYLVLGIMTGFMMGRIFTMIECKEKKEKKLFKVDGKKYESAYQENTIFKPLKIHDVYAFHSPVHHTGSEIAKIRKQIIKEDVINLPQAVSEIREIIVSIDNLKEKIIEEKIIINTIIREKIYYTGGDNREDNREIVIPFSTFINLAGTGKKAAKIRPVINDFTYDYYKGHNLLVQEINLNFSVINTALKI